MIVCEPSSNTAAKRLIGDYYDVATALLTKIEDSRWNAVGLRYVEKGDELVEAMGKVDGSELPLDGSSVTTAQVKKAKRNQGKKAVARRSKVPAAPPSRPSPSPSLTTSALKRKRDSKESIDDDARRLAKMARNAGQKYTVTQEDKMLLVRYLADVPKGVDWNGVLMAFVENKEGAGRWSYPTWARVLREEKEFFQNQVTLLRRSSGSASTVPTM